MLRCGDSFGADGHRPTSRPPALQRATHRGSTVTQWHRCNCGSDVIGRSGANTSGTERVATLARPPELSKLL